MTLLDLHEDDGAGWRGEISWVITITGLFNPRISMASEQWNNGRGPGRLQETQHRKVIFEFVCCLLSVRPETWDHHLEINEGLGCGGLCICTYICMWSLQLLSLCQSVCAGREESLSEWGRQSNFPFWSLVSEGDMARQARQPGCHHT